jgi:hypothetical protein
MWCSAPGGFQWKILPKSLSRIHEFNVKTTLTLNCTVSRKFWAWRYYRWFLFTNTSLKLALNLVIFSIFFFQIHNQITAQEMIFFSSMSSRKKVWTFLNPTSSNSSRFSCVFTEKFENYETRNIEKYWINILKHIQKWAKKIFALKCFLLNF